MAAGAGFLPPVVAEFRGDITDLKAKSVEARAEMRTMADEGSASYNKLATVGKASLLGLGGVAVAVAVAGVDAADKWEGAHARLETSVKNSGSTWQAWGGTVDNAESKAEKLGFTNTNVEESLARLVPVTKSQQQATDDLSLAEDIARGRHIDLEAATQLLVKVQTGHVSLLGRLGINTKDATGATISQQDAIEKLTALYGGNASAYADTFAGKMKVIGAEGEDIAKSIGLVVIPVVEKLGGVLADGTNFFVHNHDAAIALAVVVGGPLVAAMGVYIATQIAAGGAALVSGWETLVLSAMYVKDAVIGATIALENMTIAEIAAAAGPFVIVAAVAVAAVALDHFVGDSLGALAHGLADSAKAGKSWAADQLTAARQTTDARAYLVSQIKVEQTALANLKQTHDAGKISDDEALTAAVRYGNSLKSLKDDVAKLDAQQKSALTSLDSTAKTLGVTIPNAEQMTTAEMKAMQSAVKASTDEFGVWGTQAMLNAGLTASAISGVTKDAQQFGTDVSKSWSSFVDSFTTHDFSQPVKEQVAVSESDFEAFFVGNITKANAWMGDLQQLIDAGVSPSIVSAFAKAGPDSDAQLQAMDQMVALHGAQWVNTMYASGDAQRAALLASYNMETVDLAVAQAERKALYDATDQAINGGNEQALQTLTQSTDTHLAAMAQSVWDQYHTAATNAQGQIGTVPTDWTTNFHGNTDGLAADVQRALAMLAGIPGALVMTPSGIATAQQNSIFKAAHGAVGLAKGGSAGMIVGPNQPVWIGEGLSREAVVPFDNFGDMVATIKNTGRASDFMRAAVAAGAIPKMFNQQPAKAGGDGGGSLHQQATVVIVRDTDEALQHVPAYARDTARAAFRSGRRS